jgi:hypothetical protein
VPLDGWSTSAPPLPDGWSVTERVDGTVDADGLAIRRVGICASSADGQAVGSAADCLGDPTERATFELLERIAVAQASSEPEALFPIRTEAGESLHAARGQEVFPRADEPHRWAYARSNGVSLHTGWREACVSAARELIERDRILRAWLGETLPVRLEDGLVSALLSGTRSYDWRTYLFPPSEFAPLAGEVEVVGVYGFPLANDAPLVFGFGARPRRDDAARVAVREAYQLLSFLWGEPIAEQAPEPAPSAMTHLETFQVRDRHAVLKRWLEQGHAVHHKADPPTEREMGLRFADITPPWLSGRMQVAKALCPAAIPLAFGLSPFLAHLPSELRIHPIP